MPNQPFDPEAVERRMPQQPFGHRWVLASDYDKLFVLFLESQERFAALKGVLKESGV